jgi:serine/threonine-protein kinase
MRYVSGPDLRTLLDAERRLPAARVVHIVAQVASALDEAHSRGLIHRDVKPGNMLIGAVSGSGQPDHVYLSDFGLSKATLSTANLTLTGQFLGTIDYMAPEQVEGRAIDGRADEYSLGCTTFEMLAGAPPFRRDQGLAVIWAQLSAAAPSLRAERPDLSPAVDQVIARALAKSPDDRYPTCTAFATALRTACGLAAVAREPAGQAAEPQAAGPPTERARMPGLQAGPSTERARIPVLQAGPSTERARIPAPQAEPSTERSGTPKPQAAAPWAGDPQPRTSQRGPVSSWPPAPPPVTPTRRPPGDAARPRRRGARVAAVAACVAVLAIAGVAFAALRGRSSPGPTGTTSPTSPPKSASSATPARSGTPTAAAPLGPAATVQAYIAAINDHNYPRAWALGGKNTGQSYDTFAGGFNRTASDQLTIVSVSGDVVTVRLAATQTDGAVDDYQGTYTVVSGVITQSDIQRG